MLTELPATWVYDDGGRAQAGYKFKDAGDCVTRSIAIATQMPYEVVANMVDIAATGERTRGSRSSSQSGVFKPTWKKLLTSLGWTWHPTMKIGSGTTVHLVSDELPPGRLVVSVSKHLVAVIDGVIHDTYDPSRNGTRCVYGYWSKDGA